MSISQFIGVKYYTNTLESDLSSKPDVLNFLKTVTLPNTAKKFKEILTVNPVVGNLKINRVCDSFVNDGETIYCTAYSNLICSEFGSIPSDHYSTQNIYDTTKTITGTTTGGTGIEEADVVIYVTAKNSATCISSTSTLAYATHCSQDTNDRPVAGYVNYCPSSLSTNDAEKLFYTTLHEVGHVLGISSTLYRYYRFDNGTARTKRSVNGSGFIYDHGTPSSEPDQNTVKTFTERGKSVKKIVTDESLAKIREQFDCSNLNGLELEDQGGSGTASSHPEMKIYYNDFMNGQYPAFPVVSTSTLSIFESSGWYKPTYSKADFHSWGYKKGCNFATDKCLSGGTTTPTPIDNLHFCTYSSQTVRCTQDLKGMGVCQTSQYDSDLPSAFQYFSQANRGGGIQLMDFCPIFDTFQWSSGGVYPQGRSICENANGKPSQNARGELYGTNSKCVVNTLLSRQYTGETNSELGGCFQMDCKTNLVRVLIGDTFVSCGKNEGGSTKTTEKFKGSFKCPDYNIACPPNSLTSCELNCGDHGFCSANACVCAKGWDGTTCNIYVGSASSITISLAAIVLAFISLVLLF